MLLDIAILIVGLALVIVGSDYMVDGASDIARRSGISEFVIGLTIVGIGTSTPEMVVSFLSAFRAQADMAIGNVVGSNIFNTFIILGVTALILPLVITRRTARYDLPINVAASLLLMLLCLDSTLFGLERDCLGRIDGAIMLLLFAGYMYLSFKNGKDEEAVSDDGEETAKPLPRVWISIIMITGGLVALVAGGHLFVDKATVIARHIGWSDKLIAVTILAAGTSMPELATCVVAAFKKKGQLALGNIIGSNISNILLILGGSALIHPLNIEDISAFDMFSMLFGAIFLVLSYHIFTRKKLGRIEGGFLLLMGAAYMYTVLNA